MKLVKCGQSAGLPSLTVIAVALIAALSGSVASAQNESDATALNLASVSALEQRVAAGDAAAQAELGQRFRRGQGLPMDYAQGRGLCARAAESGNDEGRYCLALMSAYGEGEPTNPFKAADLYASLVARGHAKSANNLALMYRSGEGIRKSPADGMRLLAEAAKVGDSTALINMGRFLNTGDMFVSDAAKAAPLMKRGYDLTVAGAEAGDPLAMEDLADDYLLPGNAVVKDAVAALQWLQKAWAGGGRAAAGVLLANWYERGVGGPADATRAALLLENVVKRTGAREAERELARMLRFGLGIDKNLQRAKLLAISAGEKGDKLAQSSAGDMWDLGEGGPKDEAEAQRWHRLAASQGYAQSQMNLAMLLNSAGDQAGAAYWFQRAAELGYRDAQYNLAQFYLDGKGGLGKSPEQAAAWFEKAAEKGDVEAQHNAGAMYLGDAGLPRDEARAAKWFGAAAVGGRPGSMVAYGSLLEDTARNRNDLRFAAVWFAKGAEKGVPAGYYNLGRMYRDGKGVFQSYPKALDMFSLAAANGMRQARDAIEEMYKKGQAKRPGRKQSGAARS